MQPSHSASAGTLPAVPRMNLRVVAVAVGVLAAHAIMLTAAWLHRSALPPKSVEVQSITAQLIAPVAQQVAAESIPQPAPPKPVPRVKPKVEPKPVPKVAKPTPQPVAPSPEPSPTPAP
ncbi:TPA: energy transducer TonB, partial [Burkholderia multivorans]|nr:energy transducer TonB [Burkholderia multivorans]